MVLFHSSDAPKSHGFTESPVAASCGGSRVVQSARASAKPPLEQGGPTLAEIRVETSDAADLPQPRPPRNFLAREEQRRLFWLVMPPAALVLLLGLWVEQTFFRSPVDPAPQQVDTRLPGGPRGSGNGGVADAVIMEPDPEPFPVGSNETLAIPAELLARVRDDTVFREADSDAWFALWQALRDRDPAELERAAGPAIGFTELFGQPRSFRGKPIRLRGTLRRLQRVEAAANNAGIAGYWQGWLDPEGGPPSPIVIYFLSLPKSIQPGTRLVEPVEVVGYFFKRWAYQATDAIRTAPLVMSLEPVALAAPSQPPEANVVGILLWTGGIITMCGFFMMMRRRVGRRGAGQVSQPGIVSGLALLLATASLQLAFAATAAKADDEAPSAPLMTAGDYLGRFDLAAADREAIGPVSQWNDGRFDTALRILSRLGSAPAELLAAWSRDATTPAAAPSLSDSDGETDEPIRVIGRAVLVQDLSLSKDMAERHGRSSVSLVRMIDADGVAVDLIAAAVPRDWPRNEAISEPADAVGVFVGRGVGPTWRRADLPADTSAEPPAMTLVSSRVAWRPDTLLGSLGMDYGLFESVQDGRKLVADDADAFYAMLAAAGRATPEGLDAAAAQPSDVFALIDPQARWLETHRGAPVRIRGTARRAIRIAIDDPFRRSQVAADHYWELYVFVRTPTAVQVNGRLQDTYPFVCCFRELPRGMPTGERIAEDVDVAGFVFKRYRYPLSTEASAGQQQESPLIISRSPRWISESDPAETRQFDSVIGSMLIVVTLLLIVAGWAAIRRPRRVTSRSGRIAPPLEQEAASERSDD